MKNEIDIAVCYHQPSIIFENNVLRPMQVGKMTAKHDLGICGDETYDNISGKYCFYSESTALYWLWKNSDANIKGLMHSYLLLDLNSPEVKLKELFIEDINLSSDVISTLGLEEKHILELMQDYDILMPIGQNIHDWFSGNLEDQFKATHISEHWDLIMKIIRLKYPKIYPTALRVMQGNIAYFNNLCIMKSDLFDSMCNFCFEITKKLESMVDLTRPEITDECRHTARFLSHVFERLFMIFIEHLRQQGKKIKEFDPVYIVSKKNEINNLTLNPVFGVDAVVVMMATNDNYAPCCGVMLQSIIEHADSSRNYDIVVCSRDISPTNKKLLLSLSRSNISIRIINMDDYLTTIDWSAFAINTHFTTDAYYRFFIPEIFKNYKKILYLDCDMVTLRDIAELYDTDIGENWWAVVREKFIAVQGYCVADTFAKDTFIPYIKNTLKINSPFNYFQSGVMLWNVPQCIKDNVLEQCITRLHEVGNPCYVDQCILSSVANGKHIFWLSSYWNVAWNAPFHWHDAYYPEAFESMMHLLENPFILHYCGCEKPWFRIDWQNADKFWFYARKTPFYEILLSRAIATPQAQELSSKSILSYIDEIMRIKRKIRQYKILQLLTFGIIKSFRRKKENYEILLKRVQEGSLN